MIKEGFYCNLTSEQYHADKESISRSALMDFRISPRNYWAKHLNPGRPEEDATAAMNLGSAFHALILEPLLFSETYFIMPPKVLKRDDEQGFNEHKKAEAIAETTTKTVLSHAVFQKLLAMQISLLANVKARELIDGAIYESSYFWKDEESGLMVKSRPDILHPRMYIDLKTCSDASPRAYQAEMMRYGYHLQAAMAKDAVKKLEDRDLLACINICVEKDYPYGIGIYIIDDAAIEVGQRQYRQTLLDIKHALAHNEFRDYEPQTIGLPVYYKED